MDMFSIDETSGVISAVKSLNREDVKQSVFQVYATDRGDSPRTGIADVIITIQDVNDERPVFTSLNYAFNVAENALIGSAIGNVSATDNDGFPYNVITFSLTLTGSATGMFAIEPATGLITLQRQLDREQQSHYMFTAVARDSGSPPLSSTTSVAILVGDINDNTPYFEYPSPTNNTISVPNDLRPGKVLLVVRAKDDDLGENAKIRYSIEAGNDKDYFSIDSLHGAIMANVDLGHIEQESFYLQIVANDGGTMPLSSSTLLIVNVNQTLTHLTDTAAVGLDYFTYLFHMSAQNLAIVIALVSVTIVIVIILIVAIVCLIRSQDKRKQCRYNCRTEALRAAMAPNKGPPLDGCGGGGMLVVSCDLNDVNNVKTLPVYDAATLPRLDYDVEDNARLRTPTFDVSSLNTVGGRRTDVCYGDCGSLNKVS